MSDQHHLVVLQLEQPSRALWGLCGSSLGAYGGNEALLDVLEAEMPNQAIN